MSMNFEFDGTYFPEKPNEETLKAQAEDAISEAIRRKMEIMGRSAGPDDKGRMPDFEKQQTFDLNLRVLDDNDAPTYQMIFAASPPEGLEDHENRGICVSVISMMAMGLACKELGLDEAVILHRKEGIHRWASSEAKSQGWITTGSIGQSFKFMFSDGLKTVEASVTQIDNDTALPNDGEIIEPFWT